MKLLAREKERQIILTATKGELISKGKLSPNIVEKAEQSLRAWQDSQECDFYYLTENIDQVFELVHKNPFVQLPDNYPFRFILGQGADIISGLDVEAPLYPEYALDLSVRTLKSPKLISNRRFYLNICRMSEMKGLQKPSYANCVGALCQIKSDKQPRIVSILPETFLIEDPYGIVPLGDPSLFMIQINRPVFLLDSKKRREVISYLVRSIKKLKASRSINVSLSEFEKQLFAASHGPEAFMFQPFTLFCGLSAIKKVTAKAQVKKAAKKKKKLSKSNPIEKSVAVSNTTAKAEETPAKVVDAKAKEEAKQAHEDKEKTVQKKEKVVIPARARQQNLIGTSSPPRCGDAFERYPGRGLLEIEVSDDNMSCQIVNFNEEHLHDEQLDLDALWLEQEMRRLRLAVRNPKLIKRVVDNLKHKKSINLLELCEGNEGAAPTGAKLVCLKSTYKADTIPEKEVGARSMRRNKILTFKKGDRIAEYQFEEAGELGWDIFGNILPLICPELPEVTIEGGVEETEDYGFVATIFGVSYVDSGNKKVIMSETYIHDGPVNLVSGDIVFDGPVLIKGSVGENAYIRCGSLHIKGSVSDANLKAYGNTTIELGVINSRVDIAGDLNVKFLWGVDLVTEGTVVVDKSIINTDCKVGGDVIIENISGPFSGGSSLIGGNLICGKLGSSANIVTEVAMGVDWKMSKKLAKIQFRHKSLNSTLSEDEKRLSNLLEKKSQQMSKKHVNKIKTLKSRVSRIKSILNQINEKIAEMDTSIADYNYSSHIKVRDSIYPNVELEFGKTKVSNKTEIAGVRFDFKAKNGRHMSALPKEETVTKFKAS